MADLQLAVMTDDVEAVRRFARGHGEIIRAKITDEKIGGFNMLHMATMRTGDTQPVVQELLRLGAKPDEPTRSGVTALCFACGRLQIDTVRALLDAGADVNAADKNGFAPLTFAVARKSDNAAEAPVRERLIRLLVERGARLEHGDNQGRLAIHHAAKHDDEPSFLLLRDLGCDMFAMDKDGKRPLDLGSSSWARKLASQLMTENIMDAMSEGESIPSKPTGFTL